MRTFVIVCLVLLAARAAQAAETIYPCRWVFATRGLQSDKELDELCGVVRTAAEHGLNGLMMGGLNQLDRQPADYIRRLDVLKRTCRERNVEIIPMVCSVGYGGSVLVYDHNLAEGLPVTDQRFVIRGKQAHPVGSTVEIANGGFENYAGVKAKGCFHDRPGEVSFIDTNVFKEGKASLRFENFGRYPHGHGRTRFEVVVRPHRYCKLSFWIKTEALKPANPRIMVLAGERNLAPVDLHVAPTADWQQVSIGFNSLQYDKVQIYAGIWEGESGRFWLDDLRIEELALVNLLRRPGTPLTVRDEKSDAVYEEGRDFAPIADSKLTFIPDHAGPALRLIPGSRIRDGQSLLVSYYHGISVHDGQVTICMSEPKCYDIWRRQLEAVEKHLSPKRWFLAMDEVRAAGSCKACKDRKMPLAQLLGDCATRQFHMIRQIHPQADVFVWSDMFDPTHNARTDYYLCDGDYTGSWKYLPKDLGIGCWNFEKRKESLAHFSGLGHKTLAAAYYDADTLDNPKDWLKSLDETPGAQGILYTTWENKYQLLGPFGDLVSKRSVSKPATGG